MVWSSMKMTLATRTIGKPTINCYWKDSLQQIWHDIDQNIWPKHKEGFPKRRDHIWTHLGVLLGQSFFASVTFKHLIFPLITVMIGQNFLSVLFILTFFKVFICHNALLSQFSQDLYTSQITTYLSTISSWILIHDWSPWLFGPHRCFAFVRTGVGCLIARGRQARNQ